MLRPPPLRAGLANWRRSTSAARLIFGSVLVGLAGCATPRIPESALRLPPTSVEVRDIQSRTFAVPSEDVILAASVAVLQDMEYNLDNVERPLGVLSASKVVDADSKSEKTGLFLLDLLCAAGGGSGCNALSNASDRQRVAVTLVVLPSLARKGDFVARITIQRIVYNKQEHVVLMEPVVDAATYQKVFENLSKSIYLQVNQ